MAIIIILTKKQEKFLIQHGLLGKWLKVKSLIEIDCFSYPGLNFEKLYNSKIKIYSFRLDKKYRGVCTFEVGGVVRILSFTKHYE